MKYPLLFIIILFIINSTNLLAQRKHLDLHVAYAWQKAHTIDIGLGYAIRGESWYLTHQDAYIGTEFLFPENSETITGFKAGYSFCMIFPRVDFQGIYYTNFLESQFAFRPEIGLSWPGTWYASYGYNFHLTENKLHIGYHVFTIGYSFKLFKVGKQPSY